MRPYNFNPGPFIADKNSIQQGYVTSEPFAVEREGHFKPNIFLLADQGYATYATTIETRADMIAKHPDIVQRFVDASAIGWYHYLLALLVSGRRAARTGSCARPAVVDRRPQPYAASTRPGRGRGSSSTASGRSS